MRNSTEQLLRWTPRILGFVFAAFISVFALDALGEGKSLARNILDLAAHLIPTAIILGTLAVSWRWSWAGGLMFFALGGCYMAMTWSRFPWTTYVAIAGPLFLLGILFELDWWNRSVQERNC